MFFYIVSLRKTC